MYDFNAEDVFEMAEQMERNGAKFYKESAGGLSDSPAKTLLDRLAEMEEAHEKMFASICSRKSDITCQKSRYLPVN